MKGAGYSFNLIPTIMKPKTVLIVLIVCFVLIFLFVFGSAKKGGTTASVQGVTPKSGVATSSLVAGDTKANAAVSQFMRSST